MTATLTRPDTDPRIEPGARIPRRTGFSRILLVVGIVSLVVGIGTVAGGVAGLVYTWDQAADQDITTPDDAAIAGAPVRGPLTMWAQSDIITHHQLERTGGLRYAEMPREVPQVDEDGAPVLDENGQPVMQPNQARASWLDATTLTTALGLGMIAYAVSALAIVIGLVLAGSGAVFLALRSREAAQV